ncbi:peptide deformylase [Stackebrandtia endophytica]|uniref:Peptide deformylase n=1 Tax=Stackebrandtia endophytica TaxID=1496996 RepID=A0A543AQL3_9ACTN|nr:peptide deformylase [Stackebrandtia endophytica]
MTVQPIRLFGDPVLRTPADEVKTFDRELRRLVRDLSDTMLDEGGAGLAAPQLGVGLRVFSFDVDDVTGHLVNPVLEFPDEEEQDGPEGCLSIPGLYFDTVRRMNVIAKGYNEYGDPMQIVGTGMMARCLQHETDHLDGVLFIERLDSERRKAAMKEIRAAEWYNDAVKVKVSPHEPRRGVFHKLCAWSSPARRKSRCPHCRRSPTVVTNWWRSSPVPTPGWGAVENCPDPRWPPGPMNAASRC